MFTSTFQISQLQCLHNNCWIIDSTFDFWPTLFQNSFLTLICCCLSINIFSHKYLHSSIFSPINSLIHQYFLPSIFCCFSISTKSWPWPMTINLPHLRAVDTPIVAKGIISSIKLLSYPCYLGLFETMTSSDLTKSPLSPWHPNCCQKLYL